jgi:predicted acyltransferase
MAESKPDTEKPARLWSVDVFRGLTIVVMILVNNPGNHLTTYWPLEHADWHGWTPTDLVFPFFLFIVGVAIVLALKRRVDAGIDRRPLVVKIVKRSLILFALGLFLNGYPFGLFGPRSFVEFLETWRIPGVLQRIAICYLVVSLLVLFCRVRTLKIMTVVFLVGYWALMTLVPVPGVGAPDLDDKGDHLAGWIDRAVFGDHVYRHAIVYDPEGILSTIPAFATTLFGVFAGLLLVAAYDPVEKVARLFVSGSVLVIFGFVWGWFFPINKPIWTSSYAVFTAGLAMCCLALCFWFVDIRGERRIAKIFVIYGVNAIALYVGSGILARTLSNVRVGDASLKELIFGNLFASWLPPYPASLAYAITWIFGWFLVLAWMYRRRLLIKI